MTIEKPKNSALIIVVDAIELFQQKITHENQEQIINKYVALMDPDGFGSPFGESNKDQMTVIYEGGEMVWSITTLVEHEGLEEGGTDYKVVLESMVQEIDPKKSKGFFKEGIQINVDGKNQIIGHVETDHTVKNDDVERYILRFHMLKGDEVKDSMTIDPKLQIRKKGIGIF